jgi:RNA chaperone Hfq
LLAFCAKTERRRRQTVLWSKRERALKPLRVLKTGANHYIVELLRDFGGSGASGAVPASLFLRANGCQVASNQSRKKKVGDRQMENKPAQNIQDTFLNTVRKDKTPITIYLVSGVKLTGKIRSFDKYSVLLENNSQ